MLETATVLRDRLARGEATAAMVRDALAEVSASERDAWLEALWDGELPADGPHLPRGGVPYLPCPVDTVLDALRLAEVTADDVFVDLGAGLGRALALAHLWTGADCIGVEIQPHLVEGARARADRLSLPRVRVIEGDAAERIPVGTVYFMYCPFTDARLDRVLDQLEASARLRAIRLCCVDMPEPDRPWLVPLASPSPSLAVYRSTPPPLRATV